MPLSQTPKYRNDTGAAFTAPGTSTIQAGGTKETVDGRYLKDPQGLTIVRHRGAPWETLHNSTIGSGIALTDLEEYGQLYIVNLSGDTISIVANGDTSEPLVMADGGEIPIEQDREISTLDISGSGTGNVYAYGWF